MSGITNEDAMMIFAGLGALMALADSGELGDDAQTDARHSVLLAYRVLADVIPPAQAVTIGGEITSGLLALARETQASK